MNRIYKIVLAGALGLPFCMYPMTPPRPGHARMQPGPMPALGPNGMPEFSEEEFKALAQEVETFFKNMSEEELAEFVKFAEDVESGKIDINELLPPGMVQQQPKQKPQPAAAPKPKPEEPKKPEPQPAPAKPTPPLRNQAQAQKMLKNILKRIADLRSKASGYELVADQLKPWNAQLDDLVYYLHITSSKKLVEQLVTDKELLPLHDTLANLSNSLDSQEPLIKVPAFGVEKLDPKDRNQSKKALHTIIASFETAFMRKSVLQGLELLLKKYEPELLKKRKEAESRQEKAQQEAEARGRMAPTPSRVRTEAPRSRGFYDHYYQPSSPSMDYGYQRPFAQAPRRSQAGPTAGRKAGVPPAQVPKPGEKTPDKQQEKPTAEEKKKEEEKKKKEEAKKAEEAAYKPTTEEENRALHYIEKISSSNQIIEDTFYESVLQNTTQYLASNLPQDPNKRTLRKARAMNNAFADLSRALHRIARDKAKAESLIRKSPRNAYEPLTKKLTGAVNEQKPWLQSLYREGLGLLKNAANAETAPQLANTVAFHLGFVTKGMSSEYQKERCNSLLLYLEAYEHVYRPEEQYERKKLTRSLKSEADDDELALSEHCPI